MKHSFVKFIAYIVVVAGLAFLINLFFGAQLAAHVANWSWVKKYELVKPQGPLVIHTREEVRVNETNDIVATLSKSRGKVVAVVTSADQQLVGAATVVTSDGMLLTSQTVTANKTAEQLSVVLADGKVLPVKSIVLDPATRLAALRIETTGLPVVTFVRSGELNVADRVLLLGANSDGTPYFLTTFLAASERFSGGVASSDVPSRQLPMQSVSGALPGQAVFTVAGAFAGVWEGQYVIPGSVAEEAVVNVVAHANSITRPVYGFFYRVVTQSEATSKDSTAGLLVTKSAANAPAVVVNSAAAKAGLKDGDVIVRVGGQAVSERMNPDVLFTGQTPGSKVSFEVRRDGKTVQLELVPAAQ